MSTIRQAAMAVVEAGGRVEYARALEALQDEVTRMEAELAEAYAARDRWTNRAESAESKLAESVLHAQAGWARYENSNNLVKGYQVELAEWRFTNKVDELNRTVERLAAQLASLEAQEPVATVLQSATNYDGTWSFICKSTKYLATGVQIYLAAGAKEKS